MKCAHSFRQWVEGDLHLPGVQAPDEQSAVVTCGGHQRTGLWVERQHTGLLLVTWGRSEGGGGRAQVETLRAGHPWDTIELSPDFSSCIYSVQILCMTFVVAKMLLIIEVS